MSDDVSPARASRRLSELAEHCGVSTEEIRERMGPLEKAGLVTRIDGDEWEISDAGVEHVMELLERS